MTLLELVTPVVHAVDTLKTQMDYSERLGSFVVGAYHDLLMHHLPRGIQEFRSQMPEVRIRLLARPYAGLISLVKSGELDLAFCSPPPVDDPTLEFQELFEYNVVLMTPPGQSSAGASPHPVAGCGRVAPDPDRPGEPDPTEGRDVTEEPGR